MQLSRFYSLLYLLLGTITLFGQTSDTTSIEKEDITIDFLFNYYQQDGNHSPVTGGIGTEQISNYAPSISINIPIKNKHYIDLSGGVDAYSSASSDNISNPLQLPNQISGASAQDQRFYGNIDYTNKNKEKRMEISGGLGSSIEFDVFSGSVRAGFTKSTKDNNKTTDVKASYFYDKWKMIYPVEFRTGNNPNIDFPDVRQSLNLSVNQSFIVSKKVKIQAIAEVTYQSGLLSTPFHRVYFNNIDTTGFASNRDFLITQSNIEKLPNQRLKIPLALRLNYHALDFLILKTYYRFYTDNWGLMGNTAKIGVTLKAGKTIRLHPFYRFHYQSAADHFAPFLGHDPNAEFYTSDFDLSNFTSHKVGMGLSVEPLFGLFRFKGGSNRTNMLKSFDFRYAYYTRSDGLNAHIVTAGFKYLIKR